MAGFSKTGGNRGICGHLQPRLRKNYIWKQQFHLYHSQSPASRSANERQPEDCAARRGIRARRTRRRLKACGLSLCGCRPIVIPKNTGRGGRRAGSRPAAFRYVAVATYSSGKVPAGESASGFPACIFRDDCAACRKNKKSVDNG